MILLRQGGGLRRLVTLTTVTAAFVSVCDGDLTARAAAAAIAGLLDLDADEVRAEVVAFLREAVEDGLLADVATSAESASGEPRAQRQPRLRHVSGMAVSSGRVAGVDRRRHPDRWALSRARATAEAIQVMQERPPDRR